MAGGKRTLDAIETEGCEQQVRAGELKTEIDEHRERVAKLAETVDDLKAQLGELRSDGVEMAIVAAERAKEETNRLMEQAWQERDRLVRENQEMTERVGRSYEDKKRSQTKLEALMRSASGPVKGELQAAHDDLERDRNQIAFAHATLKVAREKLEAIGI